MELPMSAARRMALCQQERTSLLYKAIRLHDTVTLNWLLQDHAYDLNIPDRVGLLPLNVAIEEHFLEGVRLLLEKGADVNRADRFCVRPLEVCVRKTYNRNRGRFLSLLLEYRVDADDSHFENHQPYLKVDETAQPSVLKYLGMKGDTESLKLLVGAGRKLRYRPGDLSPFEYAVIQNDTEEMWRILQEKQSLPSDESLHFAVTYADSKMMSVLCQRRPELIDSYDSQGYTPVHVALRKNKVSALKILAAAGANLTLATQPKCIGNVGSPVAGWTALQKAVLSDDYEATKVLLDYGADADTVKVDRLPLICHCLGWKQTRIAELLLRAGCRLDMSAFYKIRSHQQWSLLPLVYRAGYKTQVLAIVRHMPADLRRRFKLVEWISEVLSTPVALKELCRDVIRHSLRRPVALHVKSLLLPVCLQQEFTMVSV